MTESRHSEHSLLRTISEVNPVSGESVVHTYYAAFNERRFVDAAALFADAATLDQLPFLRQETGGIGYLQFVSAWIKAFPDGTFSVSDLRRTDENVFEVALHATGTHLGALDIGGWVFRPSGARVTFRLREVIELRFGKIAFSSVIYDLHEIVEKLSEVDVTMLLTHLDRLRHLADRLRGVSRQSARVREITGEIGQELDAARHAARPYYKRTRVGLGSDARRPD